MDDSAGKECELVINSLSESRSVCMQENEFL